MEGCKFIEICKFTELDGELLVMEENNQIPFPTKRVFIIKNVAEGKSRGNHATKETRLILFPISGSCLVDVNNGFSQETYILDNPTKGLYIDNLIWRTMRNFSEDCILVAICDAPYHPGNETVEDLSEFLKLINKI